MLCCKHSWKGTGTAFFTVILYSQKLNGMAIDDIGDDVWDDVIKSIDELALISCGSAPLPRIRALFLSWCDHFPVITIRNNRVLLLVDSGVLTRATRFVQRPQQRLADVLFEEMPMQKRFF